jgi:hypothetical protein
METLSVEEFIEQYEKPNKAVIIRGNSRVTAGCTEGWNSEKWSH